MLNISQVNAVINERKQELFSLLSKLIQINSESFGSYGNEAECAKYIAGLCDELKLDTRLYSPMEIPGIEYHPDYLAGRNLENRYNVTARWNGVDDEDKLMIMGHSDTVPIGNLSNWSVDPLSGVIKDGKIWGRGACDDKYALAAGIFAIKILKELGFVPQKNLLFTAYSDEELGGSNGALAACLQYPCERILNMDGHYSTLWHCASGGQEVIYHFHTKDAVSTAEPTARAIPIILDTLTDFGDKRYTELSNNPFYMGSDIPKTSLRYMGIKAGNDGTDLGRGFVYFVFYTDKRREEIYEEFRKLETILSEKLDSLGITGDGFVPNTRFFHYVYAEPDCEAIRDLCMSAKTAVGKQPTVCGSALSDLSVILKYGSPQAFGFGAGRDFDEYGGAHQADEFIGCEELLEYTKTIAAYIVHTLG